MAFAVMCSMIVVGALARPPIRRLLARSRVAPDFVGAWVARVPGVVPIGEVVPGASVRVAGVVRRIRVPGNGVRRIEALVSDPTGEIWLTCTHDPLPRFTTGTAVIASGTVEGEPSCLRMLDPALDERVA
jgi:hypothetical protein